MSAYWKVNYDQDPVNTSKGYAVCRWSDGKRSFEYRAYTATDTTSLQTVYKNAMSAYFNWIGTLPAADETAITLQNMFGGEQAQISGQ